MGAQSIELSHPISSNTPTWPGSTIQIEQLSDYNNLFRIQKYHLSAGLGTHIDAPAHMISGAIDVSQISLTSLFAPCTIFYADNDVDQHFTITTDAIEKFEQEHGTIPQDSWFLIMTGLGKRAHDQKLYQNMNSEGEMNFPDVHPDAAQLLISRNIVGLGIDTLSPDCKDKTFAVHKLLLRAGILIAENVKYIPNLHPTAGFLQVIPMAIEGGTESPARIFFLQQS